MSGPAVSIFFPVKGEKLVLVEHCSSDHCSSLLFEMPALTAGKHPLHVPLLSAKARLDAGAYTVSCDV